jgi:hypothetical protein
MVDFNSPPDASVAVLKSTFDFCADGLAVSDFGAESFVLAALQAPQCIKISTANVVYAARSLIAEGKICNNQIQFSFNGKILQPDKDGRLAEWPNGFCDHSDTWIFNLVSPIQAKKKARKQ